MTRHEYGTTDSDILVLNGEEYDMQPLGLDIMRSMMARRVSSQAAIASSDPEVQARGQLEAADILADVVVACVVPAQQERLRKQIGNSVPLRVLTAIVRDVLGPGLADVDPTPPASSSDGSTPTGSPSTAGAEPTA